MNGSLNHPQQFFLTVQINISQTRNAEFGQKKSALI